MVCLTASGAAGRKVIRRRRLTNRDPIDAIAAPSLPLIIAFLATTRSLILVLGGSPGGGDSGLGAAYEMLFEVVITWLMLAVVLPACGTMGGFRWPQVHGAAGFFTGLMVYVLILLVSLSSLGIAMEFSTGWNWGAGQQASARCVAFGLPLIIVCYGAWIVNTPAQSRDSFAVHAGALGLAGLLCVLALVVLAREMAREDRQALLRVAEQKHEQEEKDNEIRRQLAQLTDANSLFEWDAFLGGNVPDDVRAEARRRVVARPGFEAELGEALDNVGNYPWSEQAMKVLTIVLPFQHLARFGGTGASRHQGLRGAADA